MNDELSAAIDSLAAAKAEHGQLIQTIAADAGMDPATRAELMAHINEEETEKLARIQAAAASVEAPRSMGTSPNGSRRGRSRPCTPRSLVDAAPTGSLSASSGAPSGSASTSK